MTVKDHTGVRTGDNRIPVAILGATGYYKTPDIAGFQPVHIPLIGRIPVLGELISGHSPLVYLAFISVAIVYMALYKTPWGFHLRSVGENVEAAEAVGISTRRMKYTGVVLGGVLCAFGGTFLSLAYLNMFSEGMTAGRGWLALAAVNFGESRPVRSLVATLIFGFADALQVKMQILQPVLPFINAPIPPVFLQMAPYILTIIVVAGVVGRVRPPAQEGRVYEKQ